jgi:hypothetical protein
MNVLRMVFKIKDPQNECGQWRQVQEVHVSTLHADAGKRLSGCGQSGCIGSQPLLNGSYSALYSFGVSNCMPT